MIKKQQELPEGWEITTLGESFKWGSGGTPKKSNPEFFDGDIPWLIIADLNDGFVSDAKTYITEAGLKNSSAKWMPENSVLLAMYGSIGKLGISSKPLATNQAIAFTTPLDDDFKYLFYYLMASRSQLAKLGKGATQLNISQTVIKAFPYVKAPLVQQKQIVAKIEELFSHIDAGIESLKIAKQKLKQYRQSVLKAAVTGDLTKEWREQNANAEQGCSNVAGGTTPGVTEPANQLLKRIQTERRQRWEQQQLEQFQAKGKPPKNDKWKEKYKEPNLENMGCFGCIPNSWCWIDMDSCADSIDPQPSHRTPPVVEGGIPYVGIGDINKVKGVIDFNGARKVSPDVLNEHVERYALKNGDFIIGKIGTIGKPFRIPSERFFALSANVVLVKPFENIAVPEYLFWLCSSEIVESQFSKGSKATTQAAFGIKKVRLMEVPLCSIEEQKEIVRRVEEKLTAADRLMAELDTKLTQAQQQKQTILASAFKGSL